MEGPKNVVPLRLYSIGDYLGFLGGVGVGVATLDMLNGPCIVLEIKAGLTACGVCIITIILTIWLLGDSLYNNIMK